MGYWWNNIHKTIKLQFQDGTTATYPNYLLFHPMDRIRHTRTRDKMQRGMNLTWIEFPLTGCTITTLDAQGVPTFHRSKANGKGFLNTTDPRVWWQEPQGNSTMKMTVWQNTVANACTRAPGNGKVTFVFQKRAAVIVDSITVTNQKENVLGAS